MFFVRLVTVFRPSKDATVAPVYATVTSLRADQPQYRIRILSAATVQSLVDSVCVLFHLIWTRFFICFQFRLLRWFASGKWIFSKHLCHLLAEVFKVEFLPLLLRCSCDTSFEHLMLCIGHAVCLAVFLCIDSWVSCCVSCFLETYSLS
jgi:hypothetical protein